MIKEDLTETSNIGDTKADKLLHHLTCRLCKGVYRDAHTINECMCTYCHGCIVTYFQENPTKNKCPNPKCHEVELGGKPLETIVKDVTLQNIVDWLLPEFKERDEKLKAEIMATLQRSRP